MRSGFTLIETIVVLTVLALLAGASVASLVSMRDRTAVRLAATEVSHLFADARGMALASARRTAVQLDVSTQSVAVVAGDDTLRTLHLREYGVTMRTTRDSVAYGPTGVGWGANTATITLSRRSATASLAVSRVGRVRRS
jgi:prepilin-type N-terminal cleavage/methylation domain-containing protein